MENIRKWYIEAYPTDDLGYDINEYITFYELDIGMLNGYDIYNLLGVNDSLVRERVFLELSNIFSIEYQDIYTTWINNLK